jgi:hypothetical protein
MKASTKPIVEAEKKLLDAIRSNDAVKLEELLHDDLLFINQNGQVITKVMDLEVYLIGRTTITDIKATEQTIIIMDDIASVSVVIQVRGKNGNALFKERQRFLRVWKNINGNWKVVAGSCMQF